MFSVFLGQPSKFTVSLAPQFANFISLRLFMVHSLALCPGAFKANRVEKTAFSVVVKQVGGIYMLQLQQRFLVSYESQKYVYTYYLRKHCPRILALKL